MRYEIRKRQELVHRAREMRKNPTFAEKLMWHLVRDRRFDGWKFRRQHVMQPYIVDFYCHELKLVVELDGETHEGREEEDAERDRVLNETHDVEVLRFTNEEFVKAPERVMDAIRKFVEEVGVE